MKLTIELTDTEYTATMHALGKAIREHKGGLTDIEALELFHLRTLLAEAAAPKDTT